MITSILIALLSQTGTCKSGVACQAASFQTQRKPLDSCAPLSDGGTNQGTRGLLEYDYNDAGYVQCNGLTWNSLLPSTPGGTEILASTAAETYYFGPAGNDANNCTSSGTACLTGQAAINKTPAKWRKHSLTINGLAGSFAGFTVSGFIIDPSLQKTNAGILINGALANVTPTTGSATGTATGGTAGSGSVFGTLVNSGGTYTVNDAALLGKFVVITGGTGSGQVRTIVSNTATTITIAGQWTAPTGTSTYALQSPSVIITSTTAAIPNPLSGNETAAAGIMLMNNSAEGSAIVIQNIALQVGASPGFSLANTGEVQLFQDIYNGTSSGVTAVFGNRIFTTNLSLTTTSGTGVNETGGTLLFNSGYISTTTGSGIVVTGTASATVAQSQFVGTTGIKTASSSALTVSTSRCDCASLATSTCLSVGEQPSTYAINGPSSETSSIKANGNVDVTNCTYGIFAGSGGSVTFKSTAVLSGNALSYAAMASYGAIVVMPTASTTITGVTAQMAVDNAALTGTWASLIASFGCLTSATGTASRICRL